MNGHITITIKDDVVDVDMEFEKFDHTTAIAVIDALTNIDSKLADLMVGEDDVIVDEVKKNAAL